jgi:hypothetical protein
VISRVDAWLEKASIGIAGTRAFSSEVDTGLRKENASKQKPGAWF